VSYRGRHFLALISAAFWLFTTVAPAMAGPGPQQWALDAQHLDSARLNQLSTGADVIVAVVDSGVDAKHPDLIGRVLLGADFTGNTADGRVDISPNGHGTSVAGIIAGTGTGPDGVTGLAPGSTVLPVRVSDGLASNLTALAQGIDYATTHGAKVINVSVCSPILNPQVRAAVAAAIQQDVVVVAAAGNDGASDNRPQYPAALPGVLAVAASDSQGKLWAKSESGDYIGLTAPGVGIYTTGPEGSHSTVTGTSFAAPHVAAAAALLRSRYPTESATQIINRLTRTADSGGQARTPLRGYGIVNPYQALVAAPGAGTEENSLLTVPVRTAAPKAEHGTNRAIFIVSAGALIALGSIAALLLTRRRRVSGSSR
jgi:type VII secretion-associated serine protease mycosin